MRDDPSVWKYSAKLFVNRAAKLTDRRGGTNINNIFIYSYGPLIKNKLPPTL